MPDVYTISTYFPATQYLNISKHSSKYRTSFIDHIPGWQGLVFYSLQGYPAGYWPVPSSGGSITSCLVLPSLSISWLRSLVIRTQQSRSSLAACLHDFSRISEMQRFADTYSLSIHTSMHYMHNMQREHHSWTLLMLLGCFALRRVRQRGRKS